MSNSDYKGIACPNPNCGRVQQYKGGQNTKSKDAITRNKECKVCGTTFTTIEVPVSVLAIKNNHADVQPGIPPTAPVAVQPGTPPEMGGVVQTPAPAPATAGAPSL